ncbi:hypothetical protein ACA910_018431 [Epithemia clementina (nom. ined.)]
MLGRFGQMKEELGDGIEVTGIAQILQSLQPGSRSRHQGLLRPFFGNDGIGKEIVCRSLHIIVVHFEFGRGGHRLLRSGLTPFPQSRSSLQQVGQIGNLDRSIFVRSVQLTIGPTQDIGR